MPGILIASVYGLGGALGMGSTTYIFIPGRQYGIGPGSAASLIIMAASVFGFVGGAVVSFLF